jgi:hypothetical protein
MMDEKQEAAQKSLEEMLSDWLENRLKLATETLQLAEANELPPQIPDKYKASMVRCAEELKLNLRAVARMLDEGNTTVAALSAAMAEQAAWNLQAQAWGRSYDAGIASIEGGRRGSLKAHGEVDHQQRCKYSLRNWPRDIRSETL